MVKKDQKSQGVKLAIRQAGEGGITKKELNNIVKSTGADASTVIRRLDTVNQALKENDKARIGLNSGAANMLINQNSANPVSIFNQSKGYGSGQIGKTLQSMMGTPSSNGYTIKGQTVGASAGTPAQMMIGGTQIRGGGRVAIKGIGKQYTYNGSDKGPYDGMELPAFNPDGAGPLAKPNTKTWTGYTDPATNNTTTVTPPVDNNSPMTPEDMKNASTVGTGMMSGGGAGAAGANKLGRAQSRLRQLGIYGRGTGLLGRGLQYGNVLNK